VSICGIGGMACASVGCDARGAGAPGRGALVTTLGVGVGPPVTGPAGGGTSGRAGSGTIGRTPERDAGGGTLGLAPRGGGGALPGAGIVLPSGSAAASEATLGRLGGGGTLAAFTRTAVPGRTGGSKVGGAIAGCANGGG
jgi:hypothetical protein